MAYMLVPQDPLFIVAVRVVTALGWLSSIMATHDLISWGFDQVYPLILERVTNHPRLWGLTWGGFSERRLSGWQALGPPSLVPCLRCFVPKRRLLERLPRRTWTVMLTSPRSQIGLHLFS